MFALSSEIAHFGGGGGSIGEQSPAKVRIVPGERNQMRAIAGAHLVLVGLDNRIKRRRFDQPLLHQQTFQRPGAQFGF